MIHISGSLGKHRINESTRDVGETVWFFVRSYGYPPNGQGKPNCEYCRGDGVVYDQKGMPNSRCVCTTMKTVTKQSLEKGIIRDVIINLDTRCVDVVNLEYRIEGETSGMKYVRHDKTYDSEDEAEMNRPEADEWNN